MEISPCLIDCLCFPNWDLNDFIWCICLMHQELICCSHQRQQVLTSHPEHAAKSALTAVAALKCKTMVEIGHWVRGSVQCDPILRCEGLTRSEDPPECEDEPPRVEDGKAVDFPMRSAIFWRYRAFSSDNLPTSLARESSLEPVPLPPNPLPLVLSTIPELKAARGSNGRLCRSTDSILQV